MSVEGKITIDIKRERKTLTLKDSVKVSSSRRTNIADFLKGKSADEAISILPVIFNICGQAHAHAAKMAFDQPHDGSYLTVLCENAREHILRIFTGWNNDDKTDISKIQLSEIVGLVSKMKGVVENNSEDTTSNVNQIAQQIRTFLQVNIFHVEPNQWLRFESDEELLNWAQNTQTIAGRFILTTYNKSWQCVGAIDPNFLPQIDADKLCEKMHEDVGADFIAQPQWAGKCYETGALSRNKDHPLIGALAQQHGYGLLTRQIARLIELANIPNQIERHAKMSNTEKSKKGFGQVETARGRLSHSVILENNTILDYKILAPTEWNFHPNGAVTSALQSLSALTNFANDEIEEIAELVIEAIDPCVAYEVRVC